MKAHKYWSIGALITMICTFLTGHMNKMIHAGDYSQGTAPPIA